MEGVTHGYSYFPILIDKEKFGKSRDEVYEHLKSHDIYSRRYFYPLISNFDPYNKLESSNPKNLQVATKAAEEVLCLPIYVELEGNEIFKIVSIVGNLKSKFI
jgi:dTDP-4-amino-4,6-dideoxygalactose transaminase